MIESVCVYCGSSQGNDPTLHGQAELLGRLIATNNIRLVYGGGASGLMGIVARAALAAGGEVLGILPTFLHKKEIVLEECTELITVPSMHARKNLMIDESDALIALSGGLGTLDELFEALTWLQLNLHDLPTYLVNTNGYYDHLIAQIEKMRSTEFVTDSTYHLLKTVHAVEHIPFLNKSM